MRCASEGAGLGNAFLSHIQSVDGVYHVMRCFESSEVVHVEESVDPVRDAGILMHELCQKDLEFVEKAEQFEMQQVRKTGGRYKLSPLFTNTIEKLKTMLSADQPIRAGEWTPSEIELINEKIRLITTKPMVYIANVSMNDYLQKKNKWLAKLHQWIQTHGGGPLIPLSVEYEQDRLHTTIPNPESETTVTSALPKLIKLGYQHLHLIYFFTAGEKEVRAWTVYQGANAVEAASVIHSDFGKAFIKAEVVAYNDFHSLCNGQKGMGPIRAAGKYRIEGKNYIVQDGDIIYFQIGQLTAKKK
ncbi:hypothetical protein HMI56_005500 [Coelomomyces lativittatus]|nr:hypothetical protein HMI56_005500 [Coelomomyces lativittatus]